MGHTHVVGGRYQIENSLGSHGGKRQYLATDLITHSSVLLETLEDIVAHDERALNGLRYEIELSYLLKGPYFLGYLDSVTENNALYLVWKYCDATSMTRNDSLHALHERQVCTIVSRLVHALYNAHERGVIHGALSTDVILLTPTLEPIITGFSAPGATVLTDPGILHGVSAYRAAAPELFEGDEIDRSCDYYSIGVIATYLFDGIDKKTIKNKGDVSLAHARDVIMMLSSSDRSLRQLAAERILDPSFLDELATPAWGQEALILSKKQIRSIKRSSLLTRKNRDLHRWYLGVALRFVLIVGVALAVVIALSQLLDQR